MQNEMDSLDYQENFDPGDQEVVNQNDLEDLTQSRKKITASKAVFQRNTFQKNKMVDDEESSVKEPVVNPFSAIRSKIQTSYERTKVLPRQFMSKAKTVTQNLKKSPTIKAATKAKTFVGRIASNVVGSGINKIIEAKEKSSIFKSKIKPANVTQKVVNAGSGISNFLKKSGTFLGNVARISRTLVRHKSIYGVMHDLERQKLAKNKQKRVHTTDHQQHAVGTQHLDPVQSSPFVGDEPSVDVSGEGVSSVMDGSMSNATSGVSGGGVSSVMDGSMSNATSGNSSQNALEVLNKIYQMLSMTHNLVGKISTDVSFISGNSSSGRAESNLLNANIKARANITPTTSGNHGHIGEIAHHDYEHKESEHHDNVEHNDKSDKKEKPEEKSGSIGGKLATALKMNSVVDVAAVLSPIVAILATGWAAGKFMDSANEKGYELLKPLLHGEKRPSLGGDLKQGQEVAESVLPSASKLGKRDIEKATGEYGSSGNAKTAMKILMDKGWSKEQAAGIAANLEAESGFNTKALGDQGKAAGIAQWHPDRQKRFEEVYGKKLSEATFEEQVGFVDWELKNTEKKAGDKIKSAKSATEAAAFGEQYYERSALGQKGGVQQRRVENASRYAEFKDEELDSIKKQKQGEAVHTNQGPWIENVTKNELNLKTMEPEHKTGPWIEAAEPQKLSATLIQEPKPESNLIMNAIKAPTIQEKPSEIQQLQKTISQMNPQSQSTQTTIEKQNQQAVQSSIMKVRNDDPLLLTLQYGNIKTI